MTRKQIIGFVCGVLGIAVCCALIVLYSMNRDVAPPLVFDEEPASQAPLEIPEITASKPAAASIPPIKPIRQEPPQVIPDNTPPPVDPSKDTVETKDSEGNVVQTRDWESQRELEQGTDLKNPDTIPQYTAPPASSAPPAPPASSAPANPGNSTSGSDRSAPSDPNEIRVFDGQEYLWFPGFGWVIRGSGNTTIYVEVELSGNKVGY